MKKYFGAILIMVLMCACNKTPLKDNNLKNEKIDSYEENVLRDEEVKTEKDRGEIDERTLNRLCAGYLNGRYMWLNYSYDNYQLYDLVKDSVYRHEGVENFLYCDDIDADSIIVFVDSVNNRGYFNFHTKEIAIEAEYDKAWLFNEGVAAVRKGNRVGFIDKRGRVVIPFKFYDKYFAFSDVYRFYNGYCKALGENGRLGLIDHKGRWVVKPMYQRIKRPMENGWRKVKINDKWGLLDENLKMVVPAKYAYLNFVDGKNDRLEVTKDGKMFEIDMQGRRVTEPQYLRIDSSDVIMGRYAKTIVRDEFNFDSRGEKYRYGIYDTICDREVVPAVYDYIALTNRNSFERFDEEEDDVRNLMFEGQVEFHLDSKETFGLYDYEGKRLKMKYVKSDEICEESVNREFIIIDSTEIMYGRYVKCYNTESIMGGLGIYDLEKEKIVVEPEYYYVNFVKTGSELWAEEGDDMKNLIIACSFKEGPISIIKFFDRYDLEGDKLDVIVERE